MLAKGMVDVPLESSHLVHQLIVSVTCSPKRRSQESAQDGNQPAASAG